MEYNDEETAQSFPIPRLWKPQFLTDNQFSLLKAIAQERKVGQPTAQEFIQKYNLPGASSVQIALETLVNKEFVYSLPDGYIIYDRFFDLWLQRFPNNN